MTNADKGYNNDFYKSQFADSLSSAREFSEIYSKLFSYKSIIDIGCGRGAWLKAFIENKKDIEAIGVDGHWNRGRLMDPSIKFKECDLDYFSVSNIFNQFLPKFDLAICVEVAEHLNPAASESFVREITRLSDSIIFSSAYIGQEGAGHINMRKHSDWARIFARNGFIPLDIFRPTLYGNSSVKWWYQANAFLYVSENFSPKTNLIDNLDWMDSVHPTLYDLSRTSYFQKSLRQTFQLLIPALTKKFPFRPKSSI
jgi:SAM-dependent methyltransferase